MIHALKICNTIYVLHNIISLSYNEETDILSVLMRSSGDYASEKEHYNFSIEDYKDLCEELGVWEDE